VLLVEDYPAVHAADVSRRSRWIRGDWQIMSWLLRGVPGAKGRARNPISLLSQWKVLDNLRRSIVPIALCALLVIGWLCGAAGFAMIVVGSVLVVPAILTMAAGLARRPEERPLGAHVRESARGFVGQLGRELFSLACLPYDAVLSLAAISRTMLRLFITRRRMLQWRTMSDAHRHARSGLVGAYVTMGISVIVVAGAATAIVLLAPAALPVASGVLALWLIAPALSAWLSSPIAPARARLAAEDRVFLGGIARRTWRFFETFVAPTDNWLPPDNYQEEPPRGAAHRTSPTNIGLALLANLTAYDFGYLGTG
jgi:hypothetical protein